MIQIKEISIKLLSNTKMWLKHNIVVLEIQRKWSKMWINTFPRKQTKVQVNKKACFPFFWLFPIWNTSRALSENQEVWRLEEPTVVIVSVCYPRHRSVLPKLLQNTLHWYPVSTFATDYLENIVGGKATSNNSHS